MGSHHHDHDDRTERDEKIARALGQVPVPPRPADFLDRLDDALDGVDEERRSPHLTAPAAPVTPIPTTPRGVQVPVDLTDPRSDKDVADLSARRRDKTGRRYRVLAAAASVAVILGGVAALARDDGTTTTANPAGETPGATEPGPVTDTKPARTLTDAVQAVLDWSKAVSDGDADRAWSLMGPLSQAYLTDQGGWDDMFVSMGEGSFGKWHRGGMPTGVTSYNKEGEEVRAVVGENQDGADVRAAFLPGGEDAAVVTLSGVFELEGNRERALDAFPLTREGDGPWRIEPFAFGPGETMAEFVSPAPAASGGLEDAERGRIVEVSAPGADQVAVQIWAADSENVPVVSDGGAFRAMTPAGDDRWTNSWSKDFPGGGVQYVVVTRGPDFLTTHPVEFFVRGSAPVDCPTIGFTPNSDDAASSISIVSGECAEAERVIRHVHEDMKHNFFDGPRYFTALGYECTVRTDNEGLEKGLYRCTDDATLVSWTKT